MPKRPCLVCGRLANGSYCAAHPPRPKRGSTRAWRALRARVLLRDGGRCVRCGATDRLEAHHRVPRSEGGADVLENLETRCERCHLTAHGG